MPHIRTLRTRNPPEGWNLIEETLDNFITKMREAERESHDGKRKCESVWPILRIHHQRSRYIYDMYYVKKLISTELYEFCCREAYCDRNLIAKWRKQGFERLCCLKCIQQSSTNFGTTCICRVPSRDLDPGKVVECIHCGCRGCSSGD